MQNIKHSNTIIVLSWRHCLRRSDNLIPSSGKQFVFLQLFARFLLLHRWHLRTIHLPLDTCLRHLRLHHNDVIILRAALWLAVALLWLLHSRMEVIFRVSSRFCCSLSRAAEVALENRNDESKLSVTHALSHSLLDCRQTRHVWQQYTCTLRTPALLKYKH